MIRLSCVGWKAAGNIQSSGQSHKCKTVEKTLHFLLILHSKSPMRVYQWRAFIIKWQQQEVRFHQQELHVAERNQEMIKMKQISASTNRNTAIQLQATNIVRDF